DRGAPGRAGLLAHHLLAGPGVAAAVLPAVGGRGAAGRTRGAGAGARLARGGGPQRVRRVLGAGHGGRAGRGAPVLGRVGRAGLSRRPEVHGETVGGGDRGGDGQQRRFGVAGEGPRPAPPAHEVGDHV